MLREIEWGTFNGRYVYKKELMDYYELGAKPGGFLERILMNDLQGTMLRVDMEDASWLTTANVLCHWLYVHMPAVAHGSIFRYDDWCKKGGRQGRLNAEARQSAQPVQSVDADKQREQPQPD